MGPKNFHPDFREMLPRRGIAKAVSCRRKGEPRKENYAWGNMGIVCPDRKTRELCAQVRAPRKLALVHRFGSGNFDPTINKIKVLSRHDS